VEAIAVSFGKVPSPFTIPILMADILITRAVDLRRNFLERMLHVESETRSGPGAEETSHVTQLPKVLPDYRALVIELSDANRQLGLSQLSVERARLILEFVVKNSNPEQYNLQLPSHFKETASILTARAQFMLSSVEHIKAEQSNAPIRLRCQNTVVTNLVAQQDVALSIEVARDSRELAAASRRDSSAMRVIAVLGTVFLPGTFTAVSLSFSTNVTPPLTILDCPGTTVVQVGFKNQQWCLFYPAMDLFCHHDTSYRDYHGHHILLVEISRASRYGASNESSDSWCIRGH
jgi:hypothetical protein